ncbi:MAG TPA: aspartate ammonia-lyase [Planctomycetota bacterium]|nr:aspartate ammonia-lyase [Planctomycetota bacterium]
MPHNDDLASAFRQVHIFTKLTPEESARLLAQIERRVYREGETLFVEGDRRARLLLIRRGAVQLTRVDPYGVARPVVTLVRGDLLGEGMLIEGSVHSTTATAIDEVEVAFLHADKLRAFVGNDHALEKRMLSSLLAEVVGRVDQLLFRTSGVTHAFSTGRTRTEHDLLGDGPVQAEAYFGLQTMRALSNFDIGGVRLNAYPNLIKALAMIKKACALANRDCGAIRPELAAAIADAADEVIAGKLHDYFVVDVLQGGAGTSTNMNANEVLANRALELLGHDKGDYERLHPNNHVNCSQSTNDVYPSALKLSMILSSQRLIDSVEGLAAAFVQKAQQFGAVVKMGRTQLQDAVPMTLGQEFGAFAASLRQELAGLQQTRNELRVLNLGGTAIGTGLNTPKGYRDRAMQHLRQVTGIDLTLAVDLIEATADTQAFVMFSSSLKSLAIKLSKICNDLRLLSSGPRAGLGEINLPPRQPGSSIMPGKVNPVIPEVVNQVAFRVIGNDLTVALAAEAGQLQLNVMEPVIASCILESLKILANAVQTLRHNCVEGIEANVEQCRHFVENSIGLVTALVPVLGYEVATQVAADALATRRSVADVLRGRGLFTEPIAAILAPERMANPD